MDGSGSAPSTAAPARKLFPAPLALLASLLGLTLAGPTSAQPPAEPRVALVIGNAAYPEAPLRNPVRDARAMAGSLRSLGFMVITRENSAKPNLELDTRVLDGMEKLNAEPGYLKYTASCPPTGCSPGPIVIRALRRARAPVKPVGSSAVREPRSC